VRIGVVIPTIEGREKMYEITRRTYEHTLGDEVEWRIVTVKQADSCGEAWQIGADELYNGFDPHYLHLGADDLVPLDGWWEAGVRVVEKGGVPGAYIRRPDGSLESCKAWETDGDDGELADLARVPFCSWQQWLRISPIPPIQYYSDNAFHDKARDYGWPCIIDHGYAFIHHRPATPRPGENEQMIRDHRYYEQWRASGAFIP
jgi:hypothetical protein